MLAGRHPALSILLPTAVPQAPPPTIREDDDPDMVFGELHDVPRPTTSAEPNQQTQRLRMMFSCPDFSAGTTRGLGGSRIFMPEVIKEEPEDAPTDVSSENEESDHERDNHEERTDNDDTEEAAPSWSHTVTTQSGSEGAVIGSIPITTSASRSRRGSLSEMSFQGRRTSLLSESLRVENVLQESKEPVHTPLTRPTTARPTTPTPLPKEDKTKKSGETAVSSSLSSSKSPNPSLAARPSPILRRRSSVINGKLHFNPSAPSVAAPATSTGTSFTDGAAPIMTNMRSRRNSSVDGKLYLHDTLERIEGRPKFKNEERETREFRAAAAVAEPELVVGKPVKAQLGRRSSTSALRDLVRTEPQRPKRGEVATLERRMPENVRALGSGGIRQPSVSVAQAEVKADFAVGNEEGEAGPSKGRRLGRKSSAASLRELVALKRGGIVVESSKPPTVADVERLDIPADTGDRRASAAFRREPEFTLTVPKVRRRPLRRWRSNLSVLLENDWEVETERYGCSPDEVKAKPPKKEGDVTTTPVRLWSFPEIIEPPQTPEELRSPNPTLEIIMPPGEDDDTEVQPFRIPSTHSSSSSLRPKCTRCNQTFHGLRKPFTCVGCSNDVCRACSSRAHASREKYRLRVCSTCSPDGIAQKLKAHAKGNAHRRNESWAPARVERKGTKERAKKGWGVKIVEAMLGNGNGWMSVLGSARGEEAVREVGQKVRLVNAGALTM
ncbi:hypothetical protein SAICODRAFT_71626 [Saitoella complicata NRRL Y-17804]|uniref:FYVE-type domain-containing protein n=1 Tax=Saitoella complicata (strain BCRC 22490 / CBS 7301 / JCM 7358 / NBRC 10748 / NRRL Y-17804) TaxID=698492 RepID=A0A0E9NKQ6_SAICN|nr:uncharacterized protein SAICODRAFT_71626 [Saitoella complicata NRRL Y-17804]ODQ52813.1 hypothetical protein SAICODRAFT_71626 [Saitoella complicata NRRL Y-17804]GAO50419.1 hypothetical protein G7K_4545-t1 [Saitoella complicata NRRL Y-17804]